MTKIALLFYSPHKDTDLGRAAIWGQSVMIELAQLTEVCMTSLLAIILQQVFYTSYFKACLAQDYNNKGIELLATA